MDVIYLFKENIRFNNKWTASIIFLNVRFYIFLVKQERNIK